MLRPEGERRADLERVAVAAGGADENTAAAHAVHHPPGLGRARESAGLVVAKLDGKEQPRAAHLRDRWGSLRERLQATLEIFTRSACVLEQILVADDLEHRQRRGARDAVATEGVEVVAALGEAREDLGPR